MARMFGTDGVRGIANEELTPLLAMQLGQAGAYVLTKENEHKPTIMVGCDTRISGDMLANALMAGACSVGANCVYVGVIPTPAVAYLTKKYKVDAGVVISASHNPVEFNGIKFFDGNGYKLPDAMEDEIEALIRNNMPGIKFPIGPGVGKIKYRTDAREEYINHAMRAVNVDLSGLKIVVDCAEGASFYTSVECLKELGGSVVAIHNNPDGTNINANCGANTSQSKVRTAQTINCPTKHTFIALTKRFPSLAPLQYANSATTPWAIEFIGIKQKYCIRASAPAAAMAAVVSGESRA